MYGMDYSQRAMSVKRGVRAHRRKPPNPEQRSLRKTPRTVPRFEIVRYVISRSADPAASPAIAQARGEAVDRQMYPALDELIGLARAIATQ